MATGWLEVLLKVPWSEVIGNAPKVADGARKLWNVVNRKSAETGDAAPQAPPTATPGATDTPDVSALQARIATLEASTRDLEGQMRASSELIKALAEQNAQLVVRIETNRRRLAWLAAAFALAIVAAVVLASRT